MIKAVASGITLDMRRACDHTVTTILSRSNHKLMHFVRVQMGYTQSNCSTVAKAHNIRFIDL